MRQIWRAGLLILLAASGWAQGDEPRFRGKIILFGAQRHHQRGVAEILALDPESLKVGVIYEGIPAQGAIGRISPDGKKLAFAGDPGAVTILEEDERLREIVGAGPVAAWSPDGGSLACFRLIQHDPSHWQSIIVDAQTGQGRVLAGASPDAVMDWSPDGKRLALMDADPADDPDPPPINPPYPYRQIDLADVDGNRRVRISPRSGDSLFPRFSPDGALIACSQRESIGDRRTWTIVIRRVDGKGPAASIRTDLLGASLRPIDGPPTFPTYWIPQGSPCWSPDGKQIVACLAHHERAPEDGRLINRFALVFATPDGRIQRTLDLESIGITWATSIDRQ